MAKRFNATDFDSVIREFKSLCPCLFLTLFELLRLVWHWCTEHILVSVPRYQTGQGFNCLGVNLLTDTLHNFGRVHPWLRLVNMRLKIRCQFIGGLCLGCMKLHSPCRHTMDAEVVSGVYRKVKRYSVNGFRVAHG